MENCIATNGFFTIELPPDPEATHEVCKSTAKPITAIMDLVDNSVAARAKNIYIEFLNKDGSMETQKQYGGDNDLASISIIDDGKGMSMSELQKAMQIGGSKNGKNYQSQSKWATGLKTSGAFLGNRLTILTKVKNEEGNVSYSQSVYDIEKMNQIGKWCVSFTADSAVIDKDLKRRLDSKAKESGTIVHIDLLSDKCYTKITSARAATLGVADRSPLGLRYGFQMMEGITSQRKKIKVNGIDVKGRSVFPNGGSMVVRKKEVSFKGVKYVIHASVLPLGQTAGFGETGIFVRRNNVVLDNIGLMSKKHGPGQRTNHMTILLDVDGKFDDYLTPDISKNKVRWDENFSKHFFDIDVWKTVLAPTIKERENFEKESKRDKNAERAAKHFENISQRVAKNGSVLGVEPESVVSFKLDRNSHLPSTTEYKFEENSNCLWFGEASDVNKVLAGRSEEVKALFYSLFSCYANNHDLSLSNNEDAQKVYDFLNETAQFFSQIS